MGRNSIPAGRPGARRAAGSALLAMVALLPACSAAWYRAQADRDVYAELERRRPRVPEVAGALDLEAAETKAAPARRAATVRLTLAEALRLSAEASREYRQEREEVYLAALAFTGVRQRFRVIPALGVDGEVSKTSGEDASVSATPSGSLSKALETGGSWVVSLVSTFLKNIGDPAATAQTILASELVLPLARGRGLAAREALTQAERDVLYALRSFARFQQEFAARIATSFYRVAQDRETLANEDASVRSLEVLFERAKSFGPEGAGRLPDFQVDQTRQDLLRAQERRVRARQAFEAAVDRLKLQLGVPVTTEVVIPEGVFSELTKKGLEPVPMDLGTALATALSRRLDLANSRDGLLDAERRVLVAADALGPQVDLTLAGDATTPGSKPFDLSRATASGRVGLSVDLPLERTPERNAYRSAQIAATRAKRAVEGLEDGITADVRQAWRTLEQARQSYALQEEGVRLATRRVESANLNLQAGKAETRDVLDAEESLIQAKNALTAALVDYVVALIELQRDAGTLRP